MLLWFCQVDGFRFDLMGHIMKSTMVYDILLTLFFQTFLIKFLQRSSSCSVFRIELKFVGCCSIVSYLCLLALFRPLISYYLHYLLNYLVTYSNQTFKQF